MEIVVVKTFNDLPNIVQSNEGKLYQLSYIDAMGRLRRFKELKPKEHHGSMYYRIERDRYSEFKLATISKRCYKVIDLSKKVIK
jgi:hypothetical protein